MAVVKVSICIPTYNNVSEADRLLKSIYEQEYKDFEVNISDDSTNDEIQNLVSGYIQSGCENINYIHNKKPYGHIFNWNAAIKMAKGEYIKIMFSDDWFTDSKSLGSFVKLLDNNPKAMLAFSGSRQASLDSMAADGSMPYYDRHASKKFVSGLKKDYRLFFLGNEIGAPSASMYRRGGELTLFDEKSNWASDMYLYFDILIKSNNFVFTKLPLVSIGMHDHQYTESFSDKDMRIYNDYRYMYEKYNLRECRECREYFAKKFIVKYRTGIKEADALGIERKLYIKLCISEFFDSAKCFMQNKLRKAGLIKK